MSPKSYLEIKVRMEDDDKRRRIKEAFERAAQASEPSLSLSQWLIAAGLEKLERQTPRKRQPAHHMGRPVDAAENAGRADRKRGPR